MRDHRSVINLRGESEVREPHAPVRTTPPRARRVVVVVLAAAVCCGAGYGIYRLLFHASPVDAPHRMIKSTAEAPADLVARIGKHLLLPQHETPTIATVSDLAPLKDQAFFKNAQLGDRVLLYAEAARAVLYRPSEDKVIEMAPITK